MKLATHPDVRSRSALTLILLIFASADCGSTQPDAPPARLELQLGHAVLDNGTELVVAPDHAVSVVSAAVAFRAGAFTEDDSVNGYSHLFEHMIFRGSEDIPDALEFRSRLNALGALTNAETGIDGARYYLTVEHDKLDDALALFAGALRRPALLEKDLEVEKQVVLDEFDLRASDPVFPRRQRLLQELFGDYFSRVNTIGTRETVTSATVEQLREAHSRYYVPNNALLVLAGDITLTEGRELAQRHFGDWSPTPDPFADGSLPDPSLLEANRSAVIEAPIKDTEIVVAWRCPGVQDYAKTEIVGRLLSKVTSQGSHNFQSLVNPGLANLANLRYTATRRASYLLIDLSMPQGNEAWVLRLLHDVISSLAEPGDTSRAQLAKAKDDLWSDFFSASDDSEAAAASIAEEWGLTSISHYDKYLDDLYATDPGDLTRFARQYLRNQPHVLLYISSHDNIEQQRGDSGEHWLEGKP